MIYYVIGIKEFNGITDNLIYFKSEDESIKYPSVFEEMSIDYAGWLITKEKRKFKTAYFDVNILIVGADILVVQENGKEYLRTNGNKTSKDNLDNLPIFKNKP